MLVSGLDHRLAKMHEQKMLAPSIPKFLPYPLIGEYSHDETQEQIERLGAEGIDCRVRTVFSPAAGAKVMFALFSLGFCVYGERKFVHSSLARMLIGKLGSSEILVEVKKHPSLTEIQRATSIEYAIS